MHGIFTVYITGTGYRAVWQTPEEEKKSPDPAGTKNVFSRIGDLDDKEMQRQILNTARATGVPEEVVRKLFP